jgi:hypothetical protein
MNFARRKGLYFREVAGTGYKGEVRPTPAFRLLRVGAELCVNEIPSPDLSGEYCIFQFIGQFVGYFCAIPVYRLLAACYERKGNRKRSLSTAIPLSRKYSLKNSCGIVCVYSDIFGGQVGGEEVQRSSAPVETHCNSGLRFGKLFVCGFLVEGTCG